MRQGATGRLFCASTAELVVANGDVVHTRFGATDACPESTRNGSLSTPSPFFSFGHSWVVFSLHVSFPFAPGKVWALPILVRLYRKRKKSKLAPGRRGKSERKQTGRATDEQYRTRPQLALEMIKTIARWLGPRKLRVLGDSEYAGGSVSRHLPVNTELISRMTMNAAFPAARSCVTAF